MNQKERQFVQTVWQYYHKNGRHTLPWRLQKHQKPYNILVSEIMLQQTQVDRVIPKYRAFMKRWPTARALAAATLGEVLSEWQGLGYNRRAKMLWQCSKTITSEQNNRWPSTFAGLKELPGVGPYTAGAVMAFAYNQAVPLIETNVRTVYIHHFFNDTTTVSDEAILVKVAKTVPSDNAREWYAAVMDYGSYLKRTYGNNIEKSKHYKKQSIFKGSDREVRGAIIRALTAKSYTLVALQTQLFDVAPLKVEEQLNTLLNESMIEKAGRRYQLPTT